MRPPRRLSIALALAAVCMTARSTAAQLPPNFVSVPVGSNWQQPVGIAFASSNALLVWEKAGRVWSVVNGVKSAQPVLDISEEVGDWRDHGCLGFAVDPDFAQNGRIYVGYVVDYHHLRWFGTPQYSPTTSQYFHDTIARVTRFTLDPATLVLVPNSRTVLLGESMTTGIPICHQSHGMGSLVFGSDGTLLVSCGDGASYEIADTGGSVSGSSNTALADGIIRPKENVGAFRAQLVDALNGKVLRLDPETGDGVSSNPFYDALAPRAPRSRVWALGLRNPFRMSHQPGTGVVDPALGNPGTLWIGDVGWNAYEELDVCVGPALNFGWPLYEGLQSNGSYAFQTTPNLDAPNPLFGTGSCGAAYFAFRDLLVQDTLGTPSWPNPCATQQQIPGTIARFVHARAIVDWGHGTVARAKSYSGINATITNVGAPGSPVQGPQFFGSCVVGGAWYAGVEYPAAYAGSYFFADYVGGYLRRFVPGNPAQILPFTAGAAVDGLVDVVSAPGGGPIHYIRYAESGGGSEVRRIDYVQNLPPVVALTPAITYGPVPLTVQFSSAGTSDPEGQPLAYLWDFGNGAYSTLPNPTHVYEALNDVAAQGTFIARVLELGPPGPQGNGNHNSGVLRDGDLPPAGSADDSRQYDTFHSGAQGNLDWIGWSYTSPRTFRALIFQEGKHFPDGGWFDSWRVEVWNGTAWQLVPGAAATPNYPGQNGISYELFRIDFPAVTGTRIRLAGNPGGSANYISAGELRVLAEDPALLVEARRQDVRLTVRDPLNASGTATALVSLNNTPPVVSIASPIDGTLYPLTGPTTIPLAATVTDAEHVSIELNCAWQTVLHHDEHTHPEAIDENCTSSTMITPEGCDGQNYHFEVHFTVTDAAGLATSDEVRLYPDCAPFVVCAGDGTAAACPCGNTGAPGHGCDNSFGTGGGLLTAMGGARTGSDTLTLAAGGLPTISAALFFQGETALNASQGASFGDGLRCAGGEVRRLGVVTVSGGTGAFGASSGSSLAAVGLIPAEGAVRTYQAWYRNAASFCTSATFNLTNGLRITWVP